MTSPDWPRVILCHETDPSGHPGIIVTLVLSQEDQDRVIEEREWDPARVVVLRAGETLRVVGPTVPVNPINLVPRPQGKPS